MALEFTQTPYSPIKFGEKVVQPSITIEGKLRLQEFLFGSKKDDLEGRLECSLSFFPEAEREEIRRFIEVNFSPKDLLNLEVYLLGGDKAVEQLNSEQEGAE